MTCNVGGIDRVARLIAGVILLAIAYTVPMVAWMQVLLGVIAAIALITSIIRYCPANTLLGLNTCVETNTDKQHDQSGEQHHLPTQHNR